MIDDDESNLIVFWGGGSGRKKDKIDRQDVHVVPLEGCGQLV